MTLSSVSQAVSWRTFQLEKGDCQGFEGQKRKRIRLVHFFPVSLVLESTVSVKEVLFWKCWLLTYYCFLLLLQVLLFSLNTLSSLSCYLNSQGISLLLLSFLSLSLLFPHFIAFSTNPYYYYYLVKLFTYLLCLEYC